MAEPAAIRYRAFMSYSHHDTTWAKWLHKALEDYRIDKDLVGRETPAGPVPKTLRPIFRDREDFSGGSALTAATVAALDASAALVVLCSTVSASRPAVNEETRLFRSRHPDRPVIPVVIDGTPPDNFPPALRYELGADGTITDQPITVLGPDLRDNGDGKSLGLAKVIAGLLGIGTDEVFRRAERARNRRNRFWGALAGVFLVLALAATVSAVYAWHQLKTNEAFLNATLKRATEIVNEAVTQVEKYSVPHAATLALLDKAEGMFDDMAQYGRPTPELLYRKAWMLIQFARNYAILGDTGKQSARANEAHRLLAGLSAQKPDDVTYQVGLAAGFQEVGHVLVAQGNLTKALKSYRDSLAIMERLAKADPNNADWQRDLSISSRKIGDVLVAQGNLTEALKSHCDALTIAERLVNADPNNAVWQHDLSVFYGNVGDVLVAQGNLTEALKSYRDSLAIKERLAKADPNNALWQREVSVPSRMVGNVLVRQGNLTEALKSYRNALTIAERLAKADPNNAVWQHDLSIFYNDVCNVLVWQGNLTEALKSYRDSLAIMEGLTKADPNNADWQHDLSISSRKIGDVLVAQGNLTEALKSYRDALTIAERLVNADPNNADWQHNLSVSYGKVGNALVAQGNLTEALKSYRDSLAIMERLAKADPNNAVWQRALAISNEQLGDICAEQKESDEAKASFERALAIYDKLKASFPDDTRALVNSSVPLMALGELYGPDGRAYLQRALAILKQLDEAGRLEPRRKPSIARIEERLVELQEAEASPK